MIKLNLIDLLRAADTIASTSVIAGMFENSSSKKFVLTGSLPLGEWWATLTSASYACLTNIVASGWYVFFSSCMIKKTAVFSLPIVS